MSDPFGHLHAHTRYSVKDGLAKPEDVIERAVALGQKFVATTDHGSLAAVPEMYRAAREAGVQLIVGIEAYIVPDAQDSTYGTMAWDMDGKLRDRRNFHLTLLAKNEQGYKDLVRLSSQAHRAENFYYDPRMDLGMLREIDTENLICLSGCISGELGETFIQTIRDGVAIKHEGELAASRREQRVLAKTHVHVDPDKKESWWWPEIAWTEEGKVIEKGLHAARDIMKKYRSLFPDGQYFYELMFHHFILERWAHTYLLPEAQRYGIDPVVTNDSHYTPPAHKELHDLLMAMQYNNKFCGSHDQKLLDMCRSDKLFTRMADLVDRETFNTARDNTQVIAEMCEGFKLTPLERKKFVVPKFINDDGEVEAHPVSRIYELAEPKLKILCDRYPEQAQEYRERFDYEMSIIKKFRYQHMFLITAAYVNYMKDKGYVVGDGRGSAAGSLVAFSLGIVEIDPIQRHLLFERFLDPNRLSMPDFDVDFPSEHIDEVYQWFYDRFGEDNVKRVCAYQRLRPKGIIRGMARAMDWMTHKELDELTKDLEDDTADHSDEGFMQSWWDNVENPKLKQILADSPYDLVEWSKQLYGLPTAVSKHAAAVVIGTPRMPLEDWIPMQHMTSDRSLVSQYDMDGLDAMGFVKFDALTVRTLDTLQHTFDNIGYNPFQQIVEREGVMVYEDEKTFRLIGQVQTDGMFQLSGGTAKQVLHQIGGCRDFDDIVAVMSLGRPGAVKFAGKYRVNRDTDWGKVKLHHEDLRTILKQSYGVILFQEDVMRILWHLGMSSEGVEKVMKAIKKKEYARFDEAEEEYRERCHEAGWSDKVADAVWLDMRDYAGYGFNKAHAESYGSLAFKTGFLKAHFPAAFIAAKMRQFSQSGDANKKRDKLPGLVRDAVRAGVTVLPPDVNKSSVFYSSPDTTTIIAGLADIKDVGEKAATKIIEVRDKFGPFTEDDFEARYTRVGPRGGEYEEGGTLTNCPKRPVNSKAVMNLAYAGAIPGIEIDGIWEAERELLYCNISEHPNKEVLAYLREMVFDRRNLKKLKRTPGPKESISVCAGGVVSRMKKHVTKPNKDGERKEMAFLDIQLDRYDFNVVVFPEVWASVKRHVEEGRLVFIKATMKHDAKRGTSIIADGVDSWGEPEGDED